MTTLVPEQTISATKASFDTAFGLATTAFKAFEKLVELNAQTVKTTLAEAQELAAKSVIGKEPQAVFAVQTNQLQTGVQKAQAYWTHVNEIVSSTQAEFKAAAKTVFKQPSFDAKAWFDNLSKNALPGGDAIAAIWKSSFGAVGEKASTAVTVVTKPTKKVAENAAGDA